MIRDSEAAQEFANVRGPALITWLVENTEKLVLVASALDQRADDLAPSVARERVVELCRVLRHSSLELTVALLALLTTSDEGAENGALAEAIAVAHVRVQELGVASRAASDSSTFFRQESSDEIPVMSRR